jgi:hypothetical protein
MFKHVSITTKTKIMKKIALMLVAGIFLAACTPKNPDGEKSSNY